MLFDTFTQFHRIKWKQSPILGVRFSEIPVLDCIRNSDNGFLMISEISCILDITSPTVTQMVNNLEKKGLVKRQTAKHDRRVVQVSLTAAGCKVLETVDQNVLKNFQAVADYLGEEDTYKLAELLGKIHTYFNEVK